MNSIGEDDSITNFNQSMSTGERFFIPSFKELGAKIQLLKFVVGMAFFLAFFEVTQSLNKSIDPLSFFLERFAMHGVFLLIVSVVFVISLGLVKPFITQASKLKSFLIIWLGVVVLVFVVSMLANGVYHLLGWQAWDLSFVLLEYLFNLILISIFLVFALSYIDMQQRLIWRREAVLRSQVQSLESRISPHFFFNSLNTLLHLTESGSKQAPSFIEDMAYFFRISLQPPKLITLEQEIKVCEKFIAIERLRMQDYFEVVWDTPKDVAFYQGKIPSLLLQNLINQIFDYASQVQKASDQLRISMHKSEGKVFVILMFSSHQEFALGTSMKDSLNVSRTRLRYHFGESANIILQENETIHTIALSYPYQRVIY